MMLDTPVLGIPLLYLLVAAGSAGGLAVLFLLRRGRGRFDIPAYDEEEPVEFHPDRRMRMAFRWIDFKHWFFSRPRIRRWRVERAERKEYRDLGMKEPRS